MISCDDRDDITISCDAKQIVHVHMSWIAHPLSVTGIDP